MEQEDRSEERDRKGPAQQPQRSDGGEGFFTVRKKGQGKWTRMGTGAAATLIILLTGQFFWEQVRIRIGFLRENQGLSIGLTAAIIAGLSLLAWWIMNKASNVEFLIATDSEMKKVNWTSRRELMGSTKVVIFFMFMIALILFVIDLIFHAIFWWMGVLKTPPPFFG